MHSRYLWRLAKAQSLVALMLLMVLTLAAFPSGAGAATSISVGPNRISADQPLLPGRSYTLPAYTVSHGSDQSLKVKVTPSSFRDATRTLPPGDWFRIEPNQFLLQPDESRAVLVHAVLPQDALPGEYRIWFNFSGDPEQAVGMATGTGVEVSFLFEVRNPPAFTGLRAMWAVPALALVALVVLWGRRKGRRNQA